MLLHVQAILRRILQGNPGREKIAKMRNEARLKALGADLQCLDLLSLAQDGDTIVVPKGRYIYTHTHTQHTHTQHTHTHNTHNTHSKPTNPRNLFRSGQAKLN
jgi:hypothetical protein